MIAHSALRSSARNPNQNAYVESLNGRLRDECLNEHWFTSLLQARTTIETWRREYIGDRPKKFLEDCPPQRLRQGSWHPLRLTPDSKPSHY